MRRVIITLGFLLSIVGAAMAAEGPGGSYVKPAEAYGLFPLTSIFNLEGRTDSSGNLMVVSAVGSGQTPLTPIGQLQGRTDSSGNLYVNCTGCTPSAPLTLAQADNAQTLLFSTATYTSDMTTKPTFSIIATENTSSGTHDYLKMAITRTAGEYNYLNFLGGAAGSTSMFALDRGGNLTMNGSITSAAGAAFFGGDGIRAFGTGASFAANQRVLDTSGSRASSNTGSNAISAFDLAHTLNTSAVVAGIWKLNITNTAEGAGTRAIEVDSGGTLTFGVTTGHTSTGTQIRTAQTTVPTITTNGGTSPSCVGSDSFMVCTEGTSPPAAATLTVTFNGTWAAAPSCNAVRGTAGSSPLVQSVVTTTTTVQVNLSANLVASEKYNIQCGGVQ